MQSLVPIDTFEKYVDQIIEEFRLRAERGRQVIQRTRSQPERGS